jgi:hypothetical protein
MAYTITHFQLLEKPPERGRRMRAHPASLRRANPRIYATFPWKRIWRQSPFCGYFYPEKERLTPNGIDTITNLSYTFAGETIKPQRSFL